MPEVGPRRDLVIDAHTHHVPPAARAVLDGASGRDPGLDSLRTLASKGAVGDLDDRLRAMDTAGIDIGVLALAPVGLLADHALATEFIRVGNDRLLEACAHHHDRFVMLASLPLPDAPASIHELERLGDASPLRGVTFPSQVTLHRPDQIGLEPVLARVAARGHVVLIHPSGSSTELGTAFEDHGLALAMHAMVSGPIVVARMIASGVFDRLPDLTVIVPSLGGVIPFLASRLDDRLSGAMARTPGEYLRANVFYDTSTFPAGPSYRCAIDVVGASQLLLGSDYPSWPMSQALDALGAMDLDPVERRAILGGTAARWFDPSTLPMSST
jgi:aminocarboxymuconate-semialdehyde decarboxylase